MERGVETCSIDLLIEMMELLHVSSDYLLLGADHNNEHIRDGLLAVIAQLATITQRL